MTLNNRIRELTKLLAAAALALPLGCGGGEAGSGGGEDAGVADGGTFADAASYAEVTLTGRVLAPSQEFPIAGALVYVTKTLPDPIPAGVHDSQCEEVDADRYVLSEADGTWSLTIPEGSWKLVTRKGNFRRVRDIEVAEGMDGAIAEDLTTLPAASTEDGLDTIPTYAVVKTEPDLTYNLLGKFGMGDMDGSGQLVEGTETFDIYEDDGGGSYPHTSALFDAQSVINGYHMIFLPCYSNSVGVSFVNDNVDMLRAYVSAGGRIYNSCTVSLWSEATFPAYIDYYQSDDPNKWDIGRRTDSDYTTTGNVLDPDMAAWLDVVTDEDPTSVNFNNGYVTIDATQEVNDGHGLDEDDGVVKPYTWVEDNGSYPGSPLMVTYNYDAGKVFYSVYETSQGTVAMTPQEYVLLYVILEVGVCANLPPDVE